MRGKARLVLVAVLSVSLTGADPGCHQADRAPAPSLAPEPAVEQPAARTVLVTSIDGLTPRVVRRLGPSRLPTIFHLIRGGSSTLNARTAREQTETLPNHTGMVTGRRINARHGGHGVTWNDDRLRPPTMHRSAGHRVASVFSALQAADRSAALFASKAKFRLFERSWPAGIDRLVLRESNALLIRKVRVDLEGRRRALRFVHLSKPDAVGHERGFRSTEYRLAVVSVDRLLGRLRTTIQGDPQLSDTLAWILTADHGGVGRRHRDASLLANYRVPFVVWGAGVAPGTDLYELNGDYRNPGRDRTGYGADRQPVRNGDVANLALDLLGLRPLTGSEHNAAQSLDVR